MNEVDDINVWVRVNVNTKSCLDGTDDFVKELKEYCPVQYRKEYYPDACEGTEIIIKFFTDTVLGSFFSNVVFSGIAFDITKFFFKKTWDVVTTFIERNRENLEDVKLLSLPGAYADADVLKGVVVPYRDESIAAVTNYINTHGYKMEDIAKIKIIKYLKKAVEKEKRK